MIGLAGTEGSEETSSVLSVVLIFSDLDDEDDRTLAPLTSAARFREFYSKNGFPTETRSRLKFYLRGVVYKLQSVRHGTTGFSRWQARLLHRPMTLGRSA